MYNYAIMSDFPGSNLFEFLRHFRPCALIRQELCTGGKQEFIKEIIVWINGRRAYRPDVTTDSGIPGLDIIFRASIEIELPNSCWCFHKRLSGLLSKHGVETRIYLEERGNGLIKSMEYICWPQSSVSSFGQFRVAENYIGEGICDLEQFDQLVFYKSLFLFMSHSPKSSRYLSYLVSTKWHEIVG